jgi:peptidoglycan/xylan/chitin deacetylase (PgdA/CDA1 family)
MTGRILKFVISVIYFVLSDFSAKIGVLWGRRRPGKFVALEYHSVKISQIKEFTSQMDDIGRLGTAVSADFDSISNDTTHRIAVTFDDGFQSAVDNALPIMRERGIPATIFVTTGSLGRRPTWITDSKHPNFSELVISRHELEKLHPNLVCVGSHSVSHLNLALLDPNEVSAELQQSRKDLEEILGVEVNLLSFPYGGVNKDVLDMAKEASYKRVFMNVPVSIKSSQNGYVVGRISVTLDDWPLEFKLKALGSYQWLSLAIKLKRKLSVFVEQRTTKGQC